MLIYHDSRCVEYGSEMRPEQPARIGKTVPYLQRAHAAWKWQVPDDLPEEKTLLRAHAPALLKRLQVPRDFDADTPYFPGIYDHALRAVAAALGATDAALKSHEKAFALMRPPGHHATADRAMGFCYLNQIAIAALYARQQPGVERVAVWDFDAHHGNGTEAILEGREGFRFSSVHQFPGYPGTGTSSTATCRNWTVAPHTPSAEHREALEKSWDAVVAFRPDLVLVSAGFDAYVKDPLANGTLEREDFLWLGQQVRAFGVPAFSILEGGYSLDLPDLVMSYLLGLAS